jgi:hypothetical protein
MDEVQRHAGGGEEIVRVPVRVLRPGDSPRLGGENAEHVRILVDTEMPLPPILVHRETMRVVDGAHRLRAALLKNEDTIEVRFFDGDRAEAFLAAVRANVSHGLPLTMAEREAAVARIIASHPHHSDRMIASLAGVSAKTVGAIRRRAGVDNGVGNTVETTRIGRDGRVRPLNTAEARRVAGDVIADRPNLPLREVAKMAGISLATVHDVRERMRRGEEPVPPRQQISRKNPPLPSPQTTRHSECSKDRHEPQRPGPVAAGDAATRLHNLSKDPSLRFTESGRALLRWLHARACGTQGWADVSAALPPHCAYLVAELAQHCADEWAALATQLKQQLTSSA